MRNESTILSSAWELTGCRSPIQTHTHSHEGAWVITQSSRGGKVSLCLPQPLLSVTSHTNYCTRLKRSQTLSAWCREKYNTWNGMLSMCPTLFPDYEVWLKHMKCHVQWDCVVQFGLVDIGKTNRNPEGKTVNLITSRSLLKPQQRHVCKDKGHFKRLGVFNHMIHINYCCTTRNHQMPSQKTPFVEKYVLRQHVASKLKLHYGKLREAAQSWFCAIAQYLIFNVKYLMIQYLMFFKNVVDLSTENH